MFTKVQQMAMMQAMCQQEVELLRENLSSFLVEGENLRQFLSGIKLENGTDRLDGNNLCAILTFDRYLSQLSSVSNMARKFNLLLLDKPSSVDLENCLKTDIAFRQPHVLTGNAEWDKILREHKLLECALGSNGGAERDFLPPIEGSVPALGGYITHPTCEPPNVSLNTKTRRVRFFNQSLNADSVKETDLCEPTGVVSEGLSKFFDGYEFTAIITHVEDYDLKVFYVNEIGYTDLFVLSTMFQLQQYDCNESFPSHNEVFGINVGNTRIIRAVLVPSVSGRTPERFLLIDSGMEIRYNKSMKLFCLPSEYREIPAQAIKCVLIGVNEANMNSDQQDRNEKYLADVLFRNINRNVNFRVVENIGTILFVVLIEHKTSSSREVTIKDNEKTQKQHCTTARNPFIQTSITEEQPCMLTTYGEESTKSAEDFSGSETSNAEKFGDKSLDQHYISLTEVKERNLIPGVIITISVTHIESVCSFYGSINAIGNVLAESSFWDVSGAIQSIEKLLEPPKLNQLVLAQYHMDEYWYRAKVVGIDDAKKLFKVFYVDYGNSDTVKLQNIAQYSATHVEPFRAIRCRLAEIEDNTCGDKRQQKLGEELLLVNILNQTLDVEVLDIDPKEELTVRIVSEEFRDVPNMMLQLGYVKQILQ